MKEFSKYVGMDVHKATIAVAVAEARGGEERYIGEIANSPEAIQKLVKQLRKGEARLSFCAVVSSPDQAGASDTGKRSGTAMGAGRGKGRRYQ